MQNFRVLLAFLIACSFLSSDTFAFSRRAPKVIDYHQTSYIEGNRSSYSTTSSNAAPSDDMVKLAQSASQGAGNLKEKGALCYRAVKQIIADALGKDLACVRSILSSGSAKDAGADLLRMGFIEDPSNCKTPGAIRVYKGYKPSGYRPTAGDIHGHIEVVGDDGEYHSFYRSSLPMDESVSPAGRRALTGCYVPHYDKIRSAPLNKCPDSKVSYKSGSGARQNKKGSAQ